MKINHAVIVVIGVFSVVGVYLLWGNSASAPAVVEAPLQTDAQAKAAAPAKKTGTVSGAAPAPVKVIEPVRVLEKGGYVNIVKLTDKGFEPQAVSIARGESVRFQNTSGSSMRILSKDNSGLNQEKTVGYGGIYELSFPVVGTWAFQNGTSGVIGVVNVK